MHLSFVNLKLLGQKVKGEGKSAKSFYHRNVGIKDKHVDVWDMHSESDVFIPR